MPVYCGTTDLHRLFEAELRLCKLTPSETLALVSDRGTRPEYVEAATAAAEQIGAAVFQVGLPTVTFSEIPSGGRKFARVAKRLSEMPKVVRAIQCAEMALDLTGAGFTHDPALGEILRAGTRMLKVKEPPDCLIRMFPTPKLREKVEAAGARLARTKLLRVTSDAGTDVSADADGAPLVMQYGYTDTPGRWDHWPSGMVACFPRDGSANGRIVLDRGDILFPFNRYVQSPVTLYVRDSFITVIEGGFDATLIREYLESWRDHDAFATSHMGWGLHPNGQWSALAWYDQAEVNGNDGRGFAGNFLFSTGPNGYVGRYTPSHLDIPMRGCSVYLDGEPVVVAGKVVDPAQQLTAEELDGYPFVPLR